MGISIPRRRTLTDGSVGRVRFWFLGLRLGLTLWSFGLIAPPQCSSMSMNRVGDAGANGIATEIRRLDSFRGQIPGPDPGS
jgi:hypothetical protein